MIGPHQIRRIETEERAVAGGASSAPALAGPSRPVEMKHASKTHAADAEPRTVMVFLRDTEGGLGTGYKTRGMWREGRFDATPWREGEYRCDCARGPLLCGSGTFPCGNSRFVVERIVVWDTGETVYSECGLT